MTTISLSISHTPWVPERVESLARLSAQLEEAGWPLTSHVDVEQGAAPNWQWSGRMWLGAVEMGADWCLFLQDDVTVCPGFTAWIRAMVHAVEGCDGAICLEVVHPAAQVVAAAGHSWFTTRDGLVGCGYLLRRDLLREFLAWREPRLDRVREGDNGRPVNEDTLLGLWHLITGRRVLHPLPTPIDHDVELASTYPGNEMHANRRPLVRWDTFAGKAPGEPPRAPPDGTDPAWWARYLWPKRDQFGAAGEIAPHLGIFPGWTLPHLARRAFPDDYSEGQSKLDLLDNGHTALLQLLDGQPWCFMCARRVALARSQMTGVGVCAPCLRDVLQAVIPG